jgi:hypothetical protein
MTHDDSFRTFLSRSGAASIEQCACGAYHVSVGPVTLRLRACEAADLHAALTDALAVPPRQDATSIERLLGEDDRN